MASPGGTLVVVPSNHLVALRDVTGKQTLPREAEQIDEFEPPVSENENPDWVRQGQEAVAVISRRESYEFDYQPDPVIDWEGQTLSSQDGSVRAAFRRVVDGNDTLKQDLQRCQ